MNNAAQNADQKRMSENATLAPARRYHAFVAIQAGPNPITPAEMRLLAARYPDRYGFMLAYVDRPPRT